MHSLRRLLANYSVGSMLQARCNSNGLSSKLSKLANASPITPAKVDPSLPSMPAVNTSLAKKTIVDPLDHEDFFGVRKLVNVEDMFK
jgi:hypothetical protein